jgi:hypothetical protein
MTKDEQITASNLQTSKITTKDEDINGIISAVYLNEIYPDIYNDNEYFFVYSYIKDKSSLLSNSLNIQLNTHPYIDIRELPKESRFSNLVSTASEWNKHYLVTFEKEDNSTLELRYIDEESSSSSLIYKNQ